MKLFNEFKEFAVKGNMIDMAIGIIIGAAFSKVVDVLVKKVLMPPLSLFSNNESLAKKKLILREVSLSDSGSILNEEVAIGYGEFIEVFMDFFIIALTIFLVIKFMNRLRKKSEDSKDETVVTPKDIELLSKLTELMEEQNKILEKQKV